MVSWIRKASAKAEVTGTNSVDDGAFEITCEGKTIFSKQKSHGFPVLNEVAQVVRCISEGKNWEEITKINRAKCRCGHEDCMCGISIMVNKAMCPCDCYGECPGP
ncbi:Rdx family protein [Salmonella sp. s54412]|uniref:Rdx family protein n=1 Tax=unclassified Salmonella TaxID=2614656 RepID=UPI003754BF0B